MEFSMVNLDVEIEKWKNGFFGWIKVFGVIFVVELNKEGDGGDNIFEGFREGNEVVEDEDDEIGVMFIEDDEERVLVGDVEVNKLVIV